MAFSDLLHTVGDAGRFQVIHVMLLCLTMVLFPCHNLVQNFSAATPSHHCLVPSLQNYSLLAQHDYLWNNTKELLQVFIPQEHGIPTSCSRYVQPQWQLMLNDSATVGDDDVNIQDCVDGWEFDSSQHSSTIVTEWDLVCERRVLKQMAQSVYMGGVLVGALLLGALSDRYGRHTIMVISHLGIVASGIWAFFAPTFLVYMLARFTDGMFVSGSLLNAHSLGLEWVTKEHRIYVNACMGLCYTFGQLMLVGIAYGIQDWRYLHLATSVPFAFLFLIAWFHPESARWLILKGRLNDALKSLKHVARINGKPFVLNIDVLEKEYERENSEVLKNTYTLLDLFRTAEIRKTTYAILFVWFATSFAYYGLALDLQGFKVNIYLLLVLFGLADLPAKLIAVITIGTAGRRAAQAGALLLTGLMSFVQIFISKDQEMLRASFAVVGKGCIAASFLVMFLYTGELYPTIMRQNGLGAGSTMARVGAILAPMVIHSGDIYPLLPQIIYSSVCFAGGIAALTLRETRNTSLPNTLDDLKQKHNDGHRRKTTHMNDHAVSNEKKDDGTQLEMTALSTTNNL
uniref:solute carrier family 22 member 6-B-like n=1 Tax=Myxine glutinosa TaxID=7769 RepID=UPI00358EACB6